MAGAKLIKSSIDSLMPSGRRVYTNFEWEQNHFRKPESELPDVGVDALDDDLAASSRSVGGAQ